MLLGVVESYRAERHSQPAVYLCKEVTWGWVADSYRGELHRSILYIDNDYCFLVLKVFAYYYMLRKGICKYS